MKFDFADEERAEKLTRLIDKHAPDRQLRLVHVCGTHEVSITENGLRSLLPDRLEIREGPGCPVCVTPTSDLDLALKLAEGGVIICAFGDMMRVPGTKKSLEEARLNGADVRLVYGVNEAVEIAKESSKEVVFLGVGFETTAPMTAAVLRNEPPEDFSVIGANKLIPPAMASLMELPDAEIDGFIAPGHVSTIIGTKPYEKIAENYGVPVVVGGFEPLDILYAIDLLLRQIDEERSEAENGYQRAVDYEGNEKSLELLDRVFRAVDAQWRGIGEISDSGLKIREEFKEWDARAKYDIEGQIGEEVLPDCLCPDVLTARATPDSCPMFGEECTPDQPYGPCMVGEEAMCNIWFRYGGRPKL